MKIIFYSVSRRGLPCGRPQEEVKTVVYGTDLQ